MQVRGIDPHTGEGIAVAVHDGIISSVRPAEPEDEIFLTSGLVDLQVNGYAGIDLNSGAVTPDEVEALCAHMAAHGVTTFLPTLITAAESILIEGLKAIAAARKASPRVAHMIAGVHVEGPSISPEDGPRGAHPREHVRAPDLAEFARWQEASGGLVRLVTLCPHYPEAAEYIGGLRAQNVHVSIGHSSASADEVRDAVAAGAGLSTHLGNGAAAMLPRHPNLIWTQLDLMGLTAMLIADGHHLPADVFRVILRAKGLARTILVSDVVALGGMAPGFYQSPIGGGVEVSESGRIGMAGTQFLAGAGLTLQQDLAIAVAMSGYTLGQLLPLATSNPGLFAGGRGRLEAGAPADLIRFRWQPGDRALTIMDVFIKGERAAP